MTGGLAQLGEHLLCKQGVVGSIPSSSTTSNLLPAYLRVRGKPKSSARDARCVRTHRLAGAAKTPWVCRSAWIGKLLFNNS